MAKHIRATQVETTHLSCATWERPNISIIRSLLSDNLFTTKLQALGGQLWDLTSDGENPMDRGAWWAALYGAAQSWTRLKQLSMHACIGEGNGNPLQCSCLENPRDRGAWWAAVCRAAQSRTRLKRLSSSSRRVSSKQHKRMRTEATRGKTHSRRCSCLTCSRSCPKGWALGLMASHPALQPRGQMALRRREAPEHGPDSHFGLEKTKAQIWLRVEPVINDSRICS